MALLLNGAGDTAANPILSGLPYELVLGASSMDIASLLDASIEQAAGFPIAGAKSIKSSLSPAAAVVLAGNNASYDDGTKRLSLGGLSTGLSAGDYLYLSSASPTPVAGFYKIQSIDTSNPANHAVTFAANPFNGGGNRTGVAFQNGWRYAGVAGAAPAAASGPGTLNHYKVSAQDSGGNQANTPDQAYHASAPAGANFISLAGASYTGGVINSLAPLFVLLSAFGAGKGGVSHLAWGAHSVQTARTDFRWGDGTLAEKALATVQNAALALTAGDGQKFGSLKLMSKSGGVQLSVDLDVIVDTTAPTIAMALFGR